jgi:hypothetical protein
MISKMKNLRQKLTPGLTLLGLIASALIVSVRASDFPELGVVPRNGGSRRGLFAGAALANARGTDSAPHRVWSKEFLSK